MRRFLKTELGVFLVLLFFYDLIADIPTVVNFVWAARGRMEMGPLCTFQGLVTELGFMGVVGCNFMVSKCTSDIILFSVRQCGSAALPFPPLCSCAQLWSSSEDSRSSRADRWARFRRRHAGRASLSRSPGQVAGSFTTISFQILATIGPITTPDSFSYYGPAGVGCYQSPC